MTKRTLVCAAMVCAASAVLVCRYAHGGRGGAPPGSASPAGVPTAAAPAPPPAAPRGIPRLVDLGRTFCIPCKRMAPILEGLKKEYAGRLDVEFIDVGKDPESARTYGIRLIPTQVFLDASGKELARHEGFMSREDILAQWKRLGVALGK